MLSELPVPVWRKWWGIERIIRDADRKHRKITDGGMQMDPAILRNGMPVRIETAKSQMGGWKTGNDTDCHLLCTVIHVSGDSVSILWN